MRKSALVIAASVALVAALGMAMAWWAFDASSTGAADALRGDARGDASLDDGKGDGGGSDRAAEPFDQAAADERLQNAFDTPEARAALAAQAERQRFEKALRDFLANSAALDAAERARIAAELDAQVEAEELAARMSADEARMLRLALIERSSDDAAERLRRAEALAEAYRLEAERRQREFEQQQARDPRFRDYKTREAQVVAEVQALREIPGGISRDEYLRRRLQAERERAWRSAP